MISNTIEELFANIAGGMNSKSADMLLNLSKYMMHNKQLEQFGWFCLFTLTISIYCQHNHIIHEDNLLF